MRVKNLFAGAALAAVATGAVMTPGIAIAENIEEVIPSLLRLLQSQRRVGLALPPRVTVISRSVVILIARVTMRKSTGASLLKRKTRSLGRSALR